MISATPRSDEDHTRTRLPASAVKPPEPLSEPDTLTQRLGAPLEFAVYVLRHPPEVDVCMDRLAIRHNECPVFEMMTGIDHGEQSVAHMSCFVAAGKINKLELPSVDGKATTCRLLRLAPIFSPILCARFPQ